MTPGGERTLRPISVSIAQDVQIGPIGRIPPLVLARIKERLTFDNPEFSDRERRGLYTGNTPEVLTGYERDGDRLSIPRGFTRQLLGILKQHGVEYDLIDFRTKLPDVDFIFNGELRTFQEEALKAILSRHFGTLSSATGSGKTVVALAAIASRKQPTLIIVHTKELLNQWVERIEAFLGIPKAEIGIIGMGKKKLGEKITVGIINSVYPMAGEICSSFGHLVVDECHRCPSRTFTEAVKVFDSEYMLGLSATPWRRDKLSRFIFWYLGDVVHEVPRDVLIDEGHVLEADVIERETGFTTMVDTTLYYQEMMSDLVEDPHRNHIIVQDVIDEAKTSEGICLVLSDRKAHVEELKELIEEEGIEASMLTGDMGTKARQETVQDLNDGKIKVLVATGQLIGEGFDCRALSTLFLATPIKFDGRVLQYLGRVLRPAPGKERAKVYDYIDSEVGVLANAAKQRRRAFRKASCSVEEAA